MRSVNVYKGVYNDIQGYRGEFLGHYTKSYMKYIPKISPWDPTVNFQNQFVEVKHTYRQIVQNVESLVKSITFTDKLH